MKLLLSLSTILSLCSFSTMTAAEIEWISIQEAEKRNAVEPRPILVDIYTDWCGWCKELDKKTYSDPLIIDYINKNYWAVKFNPETSAEITFNGVEYGIKEADGNTYHEFEQYISDAPLSYPTTAFLTPQNTNFLSMPGFIEKKEMHVILSMILLGEEAGEEEISLFLENYVSPYKENEEAVTTTVTLYEGEEVDETGEIINKSPQRYFNDVYISYASDLESIYGIPSEIILSLGAYFSEYGNHEVAKVTNNHFKLKASKHWKGATYSPQQGVSYQVYSSVFDGFEALAKHLKENYKLPKEYLFEEKDAKEWTQLLVDVAFISNQQKSDLDTIIYDHKLDNVY
ncbi:glucosaminidase domain-containing protein [Flammeovirga aprica]|uniref:DUF255 domain-containing protein n=1 Tax=Flammeovirga aprica JL-4 TaxID=694437 RepID=A0A7X9RZ68_9BACT|nr:glucosaminidase domain-containing protein [Flammeovirga aprica]NME71334.1 DUF255 domain-containing protein [Flammeovirga aprica JL-4]